MHAGRILKRFAADLANVRRILVDPVSHSSPNKQGAHDFTKIDAAIIHANDCIYICKKEYFNSAGPVTRDGPAEILVSAPSQSCRDMPKFLEIFASLAPQATKNIYIYHVIAGWFRHPAKTAVMSRKFRRSEGPRDA